MYTQPARDGGKSAFFQSPVFGLSPVFRVKNRTESGPFDGLICKLSGKKRIFKIGQNLTDLEANM